MSWLSVVGDISNVVATGLAAFSIYITIKEYRIARRDDRNKIKAEQDLNWYNAVVLEDIVKNLTVFIDESEQALDMCKEADHKDSLEIELKVTFDKIKNNFKSLEERVQLLRVFSDSLYKKCEEPLQKILDLYSESINEAVARKYVRNKWKRDIQNERIRMIRELYLFKENFICKGD